MKTPFVGKIALFCLTAALLNGCVTKYQRQGFSGGYRETMLGTNMFRVVFNGNGYTSPDRIQDFALLRCSELTLNAGYSYFKVLTEDDRPSVSTWTQNGYASTSGHISSSGYFTAETTYTPAATENIIKPRSAYLIRCYSDKPNFFVFDAHFLKNSITNRYNLKLPPD